MKKVVALDVQKNGSLKIENVLILAVVVNSPTWLMVNAMLVMILLVLHVLD